MGAEHVSTSIETVRSILIDASSNHQAVLTPNPYGYPILLQPQPLLLRSIYIGPTDDLESAIQRARDRLNNPKEPLIAMLPPYGQGHEAVARIFVFDKDQKVSLSGSLSNQPITKYVSPQQGSGHVWVSDWQQGKAGYFLTGHSANISMWKVVQMDIDAFDSVIFVLSPLRFISGLPNLQFVNVSDPLVRAEIEGHYVELRAAVASHSYRAITTHTRSIIEKAVGIWLQSNGQKSGKDLYDHLMIIRNLRAKAKGELEWFSDLAYHSAHKIRLLHAMTHVDRTVKLGRSVQPELALSCLEDLKEVLRETRLSEE
jgi:hypothetical protein